MCDEVDTTCEMIAEPLAKEEAYEAAQRCVLSLIETNIRLTLDPNLRDAYRNIYDLVDSDPTIRHFSKAIFDKRATVLVWEDGHKTIVKAMKGEPIDHEKGLAIAIAKASVGHPGWKRRFNDILESAEQDECDRIVSKAMKNLRKVYSGAYEKAFRKYVTERLVEDGYSIEEIGLEPGYLTETAYSECVLKAHKKAAHTAMRNRRKYISTETGLTDARIDRAIQTEIEKYQQHMMTQA